VTNPVVVDLTGRQHVSPEHLASTPDKGQHTEEMKVAKPKGHTSEISQQDASVKPAIVEVQEKKADEKDAIEDPAAKVQEISSAGVEQTVVAEAAPTPKETSLISTTVNVPQQEEKLKVDEVIKEKNHDHHDQHIDTSQDPPPQEDAPPEKEFPQ